MSIQLYVYVYTFILIIDWRFVTSASSDSRMTPRQYQAEFDSNYRGIIEEALNTNVAEGILDRQEKDENQHLRNSLLDQYQHEYMEEEPRKRGESDEPRADPSSLNKRSLHHRYNNSENVDEILNSRETQRLIMENDEEEKGHVLDALDADYSFEEKQLHKAQSDVLRKITEDKIDQQANEDIGQQGVNEVSEQKAENEVDEQKAENEVGAQKAENEVGEQKAENEVGEQKAENEVSEQTNDDSEQEGDDKDSTEEPMKKDIVTNVKKYQKADLKQGNGEQRGVKKSHATLEQEQQNHARNMATKLNSEIDRTVFHNKSSQLKRKSIARKSNTRTNHTVNKRFSDEDLSDSMQEDLKSVLAQQIIARGAETERQEIIESLRKDGSYNQDLLSNIQADLLTKMKKRNRISSKREHGASATGALEKLKGHRISKRLSEEDDEQSIFAKDQIAAEERREREHVLRAMSDDYSLDPMQIQLVEKQLLEKMQGNPENNDDIRLNKYDIENNIEDPNPENIIPDQGPIEENSRKRTRTYSYRPKSEGEESLQAKGFELDDNNRKKGNIEDTGSAVNDAIKKAISAISKSLDGETKRKKTIKEVFADHVANSDNEAAVAAVTAAAVASTLVDYKGKLKKSKDIAIDLDNKKIEGAEASSKKDLLRERNKSPENALKAMLPEYLMNTNTTNYIMDEKGRLKEDSLSHAFAEDLNDPFAEASQDDDSSLNNGVTEAQNGNRESGEKKSLGDPVLVHDSIQRAVEPDNPMQMHEMEKIMEHQNQVGYATGLDKLSHDLVDEHDKYANMNLRPNSIGMSPLVDDYADDQGDEDDDADNADNNDDDDDDEGEEDPDSKEEYAYSESNVPADENLVMGPDGVLRKEDEKTMKEVHKKHHHHHHRRHKKQGRRGGWGGEDGGGEGGDGGDGGGTALLSALFQNGAKRHHHHHRHHHNRHEFYHINQKPNHVFNHITMKMEDDSEPEGGLTFAGEIINPCENGGVYVPAKLNHYNCICPMKFMGKKCSDVNYCHNSPCKNCGRCQLSHEWPHYVCECCLKYSGKHCEVPNPCEPNPCLNGGECTHDGKTPFCVCRSKFNGKNCENINNCSPNPCKNGGQCVEAKAPDNYICNCPYEWSGTTCEAASHCASNPCQNEATCTEKENDFDCECPEGYIGKRCARKLCTPNPCQNRGRCIEDGKDFHCICPNWVKGKTCTDISPCLINPCKHNGRCVDIFSGFRWTLSPMQYYCLCPAPFRGPHCEVDQCKLCDPRAHCEIDHCVCDEGYTGDGMTCHIIPLPCHPNPCLNGGVCVDEGSDYFHCKCKFPYQLPHCQEIDVCKPDPCMNGQCVATSNKVYKCMCHAGFTGKTCKDLQLCQPNPCEHGGACGMISARSFNCSCPGMWHGNLCEKCGCPVSTDGSRPNSYCNLQDYEYRSCECPGEWSYDRGHMMCIKQRLNACQKRPCLFGGTCRDDPYSVQGYKCECKPENFGDICEKTRYCSSKRTNPCANGGICMDVGPNKYKCQCTDAFQGANCSESTRSMMDAMNHCRPNPCEHSGVCIQIGNSYDCKCLTRYTGPQCGVDKCKDCDEHAKCIGGECICRYGFVGTGYECAPRECPVKCSDQEYCVQSQCVCVPGYVKSANGGCKKRQIRHPTTPKVAATPKGAQVDANYGEGKRNQTIYTSIYPHPYEDGPNVSLNALNRTDAKANSSLILRNETTSKVITSSTSHSELVTASDLKPGDVDKHEENATEDVGADAMGIKEEPTKEELSHLGEAHNANEVPSKDGLNKLGKVNIIVDKYNKDEMVGLGDAKHVHEVEKEKLNQAKSFENLREKASTPASELGNEYIYPHPHKRDRNIGSNVVNNADEKSISSTTLRKNTTSKVITSSTPYSELDTTTDLKPSDADKNEQNTPEGIEGDAMGIKEEPTHNVNEVPSKDKSNNLGKASEIIEEYYKDIMLGMRVAKHVHEVENKKLNQAKSIDNLQEGTSMPTSKLGNEYIYLHSHKDDRNISSNALNETDTKLNSSVTLHNETISKVITSSSPYSELGTTTDLKPSGADKNEEKTPEIIDGGATGVIEEPIHNVNEVPSKDELNKLGKATNIIKEYNKNEMVGLGNEKHVYEVGKEKLNQAKSIDDVYEGAGMSTSELGNKYIYPHSQKRVRNIGSNALNQTDAKSISSVRLRTNTTSKMIINSTPYSELGTTTGLKPSDADKNEKKTAEGIEADAMGIREEPTHNVNKVPSKDELKKLGKASNIIEEYDKDEMVWKVYEVGKEKLNQAKSIDNLHEGASMAGSELGSGYVYPHSHKGDRNIGSNALNKTDAKANTSMILRNETTSKVITSSTPHSKPATTSNLKLGDSDKNEKKTSEGIDGEAMGIKEHTHNVNEVSSKDELNKLGKASNIIEKHNKAEMIGMGDAKHAHEVWKEKFYQAKSIDNFHEAGMPTSDLDNEYIYPHFHKGDRNIGSNTLNKTNAKENSSAVLRNETVSNVIAISIPHCKPTIRSDLTPCNADKHEKNPPDGIDGNAMGIKEKPTKEKISDVGESRNMNEVPSKDELNKIGKASNITDEYNKDEMYVSSRILYKQITPVDGMGDAKHVHEWEKRKLNQPKSIDNLHKGASRPTNSTNSTGKFQILSSSTSSTALRKNMKKNKAKVYKSVFDVDVIDFKEDKDENESIHDDHATNFKEESKLPLRFRPITPKELGTRAHFSMQEPVTPAIFLRKFVHNNRRFSSPFDFETQENNATLDMDRLDLSDINSTKPKRTRNMLRTDPGIANLVHNKYTKEVDNMDNVSKLSGKSIKQHVTYKVNNNFALQHLEHYIKMHTLHHPSLSHKLNKLDREREEQKIKAVDKNETDENDILEGSHAVSRLPRSLVSNSNNSDVIINDDISETFKKSEAASDRSMESHSGEVFHSSHKDTLTTNDTNAMLCNNNNDTGDTGAKITLREQYAAISAFDKPSEPSMNLTTINEDKTQEKISLLERSSNIFEDLDESSQPNINITSASSDVAPLSDILKRYTRSDSSMINNRLEDDVHNVNGDAAYAIVHSADNLFSNTADDKDEDEEAERHDVDNEYRNYMSTHLGDMMGIEVKLTKDELIHLGEAHNVYNVPSKDELNKLGEPNKVIEGQHKNELTALEDTRNVHEEGKKALNQEKTIDKLQEETSKPIAELENEYNVNDIPGKIELNIQVNQAALRLLESTNNFIKHESKADLEQPRGRHVVEGERSKSKWNHVENGYSETGKLNRNELNHLRDTNNVKDGISNLNSVNDESTHVNSINGGPRFLNNVHERPKHSKGDKEVPGYFNSVSQGSKHLDTGNGRPNHLNTNGATHFSSMTKGSKIPNNVNEGKKHFEGENGEPSHLNSVYEGSSHLNGVNDESARFSNVKEGSKNFNSVNGWKEKSGHSTNDGRKPFNSANKGSRHFSSMNGGSIQPNNTNEEATRFINVNKGRRHHNNMNEGSKQFIDVTEKLKQYNSLNEQPRHFNTTNEEIHFNAITEGLKKLNNMNKVLAEGLKKVNNTNEERVLNSMDEGTTIIKDVNGGSIHINSANEEFKHFNSANEGSRHLNSMNERSNDLNSTNEVETNSNNMNKGSKNFNNMNERSEHLNSVNKGSNKFNSVNEWLSHLNKTREEEIHFNSLKEGSRILNNVNKVSNNFKIEKEVPKHFNSVNEGSNHVNGVKERSRHFNSINERETRLNGMKQGSRDFNNVHEGSGHLSSMNERFEHFNGEKEKSRHFNSPNETLRLLHSGNKERAQFNSVNGGISITKERSKDFDDASEGLKYFNRTNKESRHFNNMNGGSIQLNSTNKETTRFIKLNKRPRHHNSINEGSKEFIDVTKKLKHFNSVNEQPKQFNTTNEGSTHFNKITEESKELNNMNKVLSERLRKFNDTNEGRTHLSSMDEGTTNIKDVNEGSIHNDSAKEEVKQLNSVKEGSRKLKSMNEKSNNLNSTNEGETNLNNANKGSKNFNNMNERSKNLNSVNKGSHTFNSANEGLTHLNSTNEKETYFNSMNEGSRMFTNVQEESNHLKSENEVPRPFNSVNGGSSHLNEESRHFNSINERGTRLNGTNQRARDFNNINEGSRQFSGLNEGFKHFNSTKEESRHLDSQNETLRLLDSANKEETHLNSANEETIGMKERSRDLDSANEGPKELINMNEVSRYINESSSNLNSTNKWPTQFNQTSYIPLQPELRQASGRDADSNINETIAYEYDEEAEIMKNITNAYSDIKTLVNKDEVVNQYDKEEIMRNITNTHLHMSDNLNNTTTLPSTRAHSHENKEGNSTIIEFRQQQNTNTEQVVYQSPDSNNTQTLKNQTQVHIFKDNKIKVDELNKKINNHRSKAAKLKNVTLTHTHLKRLVARLSNFNNGSIYTLPNTDEDRIDLVYNKSMNSDEEEVDNGYNGEYESTKRKEKYNKKVKRKPTSLLNKRVRLRSHTIDSNKRLKNGIFTLRNVSTTMIGKHAPVDSLRRNVDERRLRINTQEGDGMHGPDWDKPGSASNELKQNETFIIESISDKSNDTNTKTVPFNTSSQSNGKNETTEQAHLKQEKETLEYTFNQNYTTSDLVNYIESNLGEYLNRSQLLSSVYPEIFSFVRDDNKNPRFNLKEITENSDGGFDLGINNVLENYNGNKKSTTADILNGNTLSPIRIITSKYSNGGNIANILNKDNVPNINNNNNGNATNRLQAFDVPINLGFIDCKLMTIAEQFDGKKDSRKQCDTSAFDMSKINVEEFSVKRDKTFHKLSRRSRRILEILGKLTKRRHSPGKRNVRNN